MDEEKKIETEEEKKTRLYTGAGGSTDKIVDAQIAAHAKRAEQNMRERMIKAKQMGGYERESKTPYVDELEFMVKQIHSMHNFIDRLERKNKKIEESLKNIQSAQIEIANAVGDVWQLLLISSSESLMGERFAKYTDFIKEAKEKDKE